MAGPDRETRRRVFARDLHRCVWCGTYLGERGNIHHRMLRSHGTDNSLPNLITVCGSGTTGCHGAMHARPSTARERGHIVPSWGFPALVAIDTWRGSLFLDDDGEVRRAEEM